LFVEGREIKIGDGIMGEDRSSLWEGLGFGIVVLCFCLGIGGCQYMGMRGVAKIREADAKLELAKQGNTQVEVDNQVE